jgi:hypothetical protein
MRGAVGAILLLTMGAVVSAQENPTLGQALDQLLDEAARSCPLESEPARTGQPDSGALRAKVAELGNRATCACMPQRIREALRTLDPAEMSRKVDVDEARAIVVSRFLTPCLGEAFRDLFSGDACEEVFPLSSRVPENFCACMKPRLRQYSDAEAVELGNAFVAYGARVQRARQDGKVPPPRPAIADRLFSAVTECGGAVQAR